MAKIVNRPRVTLTATLELGKDELCALDALAGYGTNEFLKIFYVHMGKAYLEPHEAGLRSLFKAVNLVGVPDIVKRAKDAEDVFNGPKIATDFTLKEIEDYRVWARLKGGK